MRYSVNTKEKKIKKTMIIKEHPTSLFEYIVTDIFESNSQQFFFADQYSKMPFIKTMKNCIKYLKAIFAVHGTPKCFYTDNTMSFVLNEFHNFATEWEFMHITSSARYPQ